MKFLLQKWLPRKGIATQDVAGRGLNLTGDGVWVQDSTSFEKTEQAIARVVRISSKDLPNVVKAFFSQPEIIKEIFATKEKIHEFTEPEERLETGSAITDEFELREFLSLIGERLQRIAERAKEGLFRNKDTGQITESLKALAELLARYKIQIVG